MRARIKAVAILFAFLAIWGCSPVKVAEPFAPTEAHTDYVAALSRLGLHERRMGAAWISAGEMALEAPVAIEVPYNDMGVFDAAVPRALAYRFSVARGRRIDIGFEPRDDEGTPVWQFPFFADVFLVPAGEDDDPEHVASLPTAFNRMYFEARRSSEYILRIQPELLVGGRYALSITETPSLAFPVSGKDETAVGSFFGDPRDGGAREHHGIDIFAERGTYVLAPSPAQVRRVAERGLGGNTIVLWDQARSLNLYFAHLDTQLVRAGETVRPGDIIGTVGNTGNAATTPPQLHFGIYTRYWQPIDPYQYVSGAGDG